MDYSRGGAGVRQPGHRSSRKSRNQQQQQQQYGDYYQHQQGPHLFDDTSNYPPGPMYPNPPPYMGQGPPAGVADMYGQVMGGNFAAGAQFLGDPVVANMAMAYGQNLMGQGKQMVDQKLEKYVSVSKMKYFFAVDTSYVWRKLIILLFPFTHSDWSLKYNAEGPVAPRFEVNAPDLYIPVMAFVTYILMAGLALGTQDRFNPEQLGIQASSALVWLVIEVIVLLLTMYIMNIQTDLGYLDLIAFTGYKYVGMIAALSAGMISPTFGYYSVLIYTSCALAFFLVRTLRVQVLPKASAEEYRSHGNKRRMYLLLIIAICQPIFMFWLTRHLVPKVSPVLPNPSTTL